MQYRASVHRTVAIATFVAAALAGMPHAGLAQTDYYNTDKGRPLHTEDAYPVERRAFELQAAPLRLERRVGSVYHWSVEPEMAYGIFPRTQIEVGVPVSFVEAPGFRQSGVSGVHVSMLHNLNVETSIPALAVSASAVLPIGNLADEALVSFKGIATRTFPWARFHLNGEYTVAEEPDDVNPNAFAEATRWTAGLAMDRTFPLRSLLVGAELLVQQPLPESADRILSVGAGLRYQLSPQWAMDAGIGRQLSGDERSWSFTVGSAFAFGLPWHP